MDVPHAVRTFSVTLSHPLLLSSFISQITSISICQIPIISSLAFSFSFSLSLSHTQTLSNSPLFFLSFKFLLIFFSFAGSIWFTYARRSGCEQRTYAPFPKQYSRRKQLFNFPQICRVRGSNTEGDNGTLRYVFICTSNVLLCVSLCVCYINITSLSFSPYRSPPDFLSLSLFLPLHRFISFSLLLLLSLFFSSLFLYFSLSTNYTFSISTILFIEQT